MLLMPAPRRANRFANEGEKRDQQQQCRKRGPIVLTTHTPARSPTGDHPTKAAIAKIQRNERANSNEHKSLGNVVKHVVSLLVAKGEENVRRGAACNGGVPHDHALSCAESSDIGVEAGDL